MTSADADEPIERATVALATWPESVRAFRRGNETWVKLLPGPEIGRDPDGPLRDLLDVAVLLDAAFGPEVVLALPCGGAAKLPRWFIDEVDGRGMTHRLYDPVGP